jgi:SagB-type dehydrogenase family enzyme
MDIVEYHAASKHHIDRYAPGPGALDWANQPDPFRTFEGAPRRVLPLAADRLPTLYAEARAGRAGAAARDLEHLGLLLEISLGLSAWKQYGATRWALRCNPSSGNLHPTEAYLVTPGSAELAAGVWHYQSREHALELRCTPAAGWAEAWPADGLLVGLSSIAWREVWKYGVRGFRYCQHDCGHAIAALAYAAAALGWPARVLPCASSGQIAALLGLERDADFASAERDEAEVLLWLGPPDSPPDLDRLGEPARSGQWQGRPNRLSTSHRPWPHVPAAERATRRPADAPQAAAADAVLPPLGRCANAAKYVPAAALFRQRRSAVAFDGVSAMPAQAFHTLLDATLPRPDAPPWSAWRQPPAVHLALFVHRVTDVEPGLYLLLREADQLEAVRSALAGHWLWEKRGPRYMPLYLLLPNDLRKTAQLISCHQEIAADGCFSLGMLASMRDVQREPWRYRERFWECGMIGQALYLEAEAAGFRGTGIGCFFDDAMHRLLGLVDEDGADWQSLYHFTVGAPVDDTRLASTPPYAPR